MIQQVAVVQVLADCFWPAAMASRFHHPFCPQQRHVLGLREQAFFPSETPGHPPPQGRMFHQVVEEPALKIEPSFKPAFNNLVAVFAYVLPNVPSCVQANAPSSG